VTEKAPLKMYAIFSPAAVKGMKGNRGKLAAQAGHAFLHAWWDADLRHPELAVAYRHGPRAFKIGLMPREEEFTAPEGVTEAWFDRLLDAYRDKTGVTKVIDAGFTVFEGPTLTCIGIGPISPDDREEVLAGLKPLI
jgi:peptidyl-tRNA hydrolase